MDNGSSDSLIECTLLMWPKKKTIAYSIELLHSGFHRTLGVLFKRINFLFCLFSI